MIDVDTSAVMAMVLKEAQATACAKAVADDEQVLISAGTLAELLIVAAGRGVAEEALRTVEELGFEVVAVTAPSALRVAEAYRRWGKGYHPTALNFGDCFAYELARERECALLFVGKDFARTDVESVL
ncbi:MAG: type II toxin-antitoxin system VapC family toxin [Sphingomonadales bacterium]